MTTGDFYLDDNGGKPAPVQLDLGIARSTPVTGYDSVAWLRIAMRMPTLDGLSSNKEFQDLKQIGDAAVAAVEDDGATIFVGPVTSRGQRMFYFYAMDVEHVSCAATQVMQQFPAYQFAVGGESDLQWNTYWRVTVDTLDPANPLDTFDAAATRQNLPPDDQARIGALALEVVFARFVSSTAYAPEDRLFDSAIRTIAEHRPDKMLLDLYATIEAALSSLFGEPESRRRRRRPPTAIQLRLGEVLLRPLSHDERVNSQ
ncbi:hypothetical protein CHELA1G11_12834 [Hyphomicrobiales bacterium]|nr:hypothetical protein CHELA1G2_11475 [Hyphomicrobiales bacterium]CAH1667446.1 hypothetical protein CHELA1G11_12834 [Hyphomicrobiales bacterium]